MRISWASKSISAPKCAIPSFLPPFHSFVRYCPRLVPNCHPFGFIYASAIKKKKKPNRVEQNQATRSKRCDRHITQRASLMCLICVFREPCVYVCVRARVCCDRMIARAREIIPLINCHTVARWSAMVPLAGRAS